MQSTLKPASTAAVRGLGSASHTGTGTLVRLAESENISKFSEKALFGGGKEPVAGEWHDAAPAAYQMMTAKSLRVNPKLDKRNGPGRV
jgi:hypothetical protein